MSNIKISEERKEYLDTLVEKINDHAEWYQEHIDSLEYPGAEYLESFYYGDCPTDEVIRNISECFDNLRDNRIKDLDELRDRLIDFFKDHPDLYDLLEPFCKLHYEASYWNVTNSILSFELGEIEVQPDDDLEKELSELNDEEIEYLNRECHTAYISGSWLYLNYCSEFYHLIFDIDDFIEYCINDEGLYELIKDLIDLD